ncbi:MAG: hydantoinase B/oxoprolinase family protein [Rhodospirillaceae bacterium]|nr:hydantoinase B/oxoprolinase family protein [Rhodospirillaceae bacterium]
MKTLHSQLDPVSLEILMNGLRSVADESFFSLMKSAYSTNIKERRDHSTAIMDADGRLIVQADASLPVHLASMKGLMESLLTRFGDDVRDGDLFVANDPYVAGGTHLPDINMAVPVFADGAPVAFMCNIAHHADVGGAVPGSMAGGLTEIYQEGLRIPVIRLFREGVLQEDIMDMILLNVRVPAERCGDYHAQIAACRLGHDRLAAMIAQYGVSAMRDGFDQIVTRTSNRIRGEIKRLPDGVYRFEDVMDDDGVGAFDIPIKLTVTVNRGDICFDFTGTAQQVNGNINVTRNATQASVCYTLKALLDPDAPNNQGVLDLPELVTQKGTLLDATFPAPVAARANTCQRIIDVILGALAPAMPEAAVGAANGANTTAVFSGVDPRSGEDYVYLETLGGGFGGRSDKDGKDGVQVHITNTSNLPVEAIEMEYPLRVRSYGLIPNSGGAGRYRGGMGLKRVVEPVGHTCSFNGAGERFTQQPWGVFGGHYGATGEFRHVDREGVSRRLPNKPTGVAIHPGEALEIYSPGAGGYGDPAERSLGNLEVDLTSEKFDEAYLAAYYPQFGQSSEKQ